MTTFRLSRRITVECETYETRYSWGHKAYMTVKGKGEDYAKITYYNRTWESYQFESILEYIVDRSKLLTKRQKTYARKAIRHYQELEHERVNRRFASLGAVMAMGDIIAGDKKGANDWKTRMLKAGLGDKGLIMPEDWETLPENEKQARLDAIIQSFQPGKETV